ncbi:MRP2, gBP25 [Strigomonas culicis]|uniref:MRP2, gBP25 n=1 Tax=Strigomonas culicis TaxID=28005 RepID=S9UB91_9TRYP|nr:MRP2, gBP25 [Strigomonas culicis]|eukprot:EPY26198.1 MRP2, gBP25 [Strigomonas culicis]
MLRVLHRDSFIVLDYHKQVRGADGEGSRGPRGERVVTVTLPPVYIARLLGVLEGRMPRVEVQSRFTNATFTPNEAKGPHCYTLNCTSMKPTTGQQQTPDGADIKEEALDWTVELDAADSLMLERFLGQALHYNTGFGRRIF